MCKSASALLLNVFQRVLALRLPLPVRVLLLHPDALYEARYSLWPWLLMLAVAFGFATGTYFGVQFLIEKIPSLQNTLSQGFWTFFLAITASPLAWYIWFLRDRTKHEDQRHEASKAAREHFNKLREWATGTEITRKVAALFELQDYLDPDLKSHRIPAIIQHERAEYARQTARFFAELLRDRNSWDDVALLDERAAALSREDSRSEKKKLRELPPNSVRSALASVLRAQGFRIGDLESADLRLMELQLAELRGARLNFANLIGANLINAAMNYANLRLADLFWANLSGADLSGADISGANLNAAKLIGAKLSGADLSATDLSESVLSGADLSHADLRLSDLSGANLAEANLYGALLLGADINGARCDSATSWPDDFNPISAGVKIKHEE